MYILFGLFSLSAFALNASCAFCDEKVLDAQKFYEDDLVLALYTHKPILPPHFLIIPKRHVEQFADLTDDEFTQISRVIKKVHSAASSVFGTSSYLLLQKNGEEVGQTVPHVHFHYIAREEGDNSVLKFLYKMFTTPYFAPISYEEIQSVVTKMKESLD